MTLYGVVTAALVRKLKAIIAEYRKLIAEATAAEKKIVTTAKNDVQAVYEFAKYKEREIVSKVSLEVETLKDDVINKIAKI